MSLDFNVEASEMDIVHAIEHDVNTRFASEFEKKFGLELDPEDPERKFVLYAKDNLHDYPVDEDGIPFELSAPYILEYLTNYPNEHGNIVEATKIKSMAEYIIRWTAVLDLLF